MKAFHIVFCISVAFGSLGLPEDEMDAMNAAFLEDDLCEGDCSLKLLQRLAAHDARRREYLGICGT